MRPARQDALLELLLVGVCLGHILLCPYNKVEEAFSLHAIHDILDKGISPDAIATYDHVAFPGPVPRSFVGALTVAAATWPVQYLLKHTGLELPLLRQLITRLTLALSNSLCLVFLARRLRDTFHARSSRQFLVLSACQFHIPFWIGRTVPNMLAFGPSQIALACILMPKQRETRRWSRPDVLLGLGILTSLAVVLRLELLGLLGPLAVQAWLFNRVDWLEGGLAIAGSALAALSATLSVDSYFWRTSVWPELHSLLFNVVDGKSEEWGVSPWYYYYTNSLPKILLLGYPLAILGSLTHPAARRISAPMFLYIGVMSILKHKEWRFVVYAIPFLNVMISAGCHFFRHHGHALLSRLLFTTVCLTSLAVAVVSTGASSLNYPGGQAVHRMGAILAQDAHFGPDAWKATVHLDVYSKMTGASNPLQWRSLAQWDKDETLGTDPSNYLAFDYLITHEPVYFAKDFRVVEIVHGWAGLQRQSYRCPPPGRDAGGKLHCLRRKDGEGIIEWAVRLLPLKPRVEEQVWIMRRST